MKFKLVITIATKVLGKLTFDNGFYSTPFLLYPLPSHLVHQPLFLLWNGYVMSYRLKIQRLGTQVVLILRDDWIGKAGTMNQSKYFLLHVFLVFYPSRSKLLGIFPSKKMKSLLIAQNLLILWWSCLESWCLIGIIVPHLGRARVLGPKLPSICCTSSV